MLTKCKSTGIFLCIGVFSLFSLVGCGSESGSKQVNKSNNSEYTETQNYEVADIVEMVGEAQSNALRANEKYKGKKVKITNGIVSMIKSGGEYFQLDTPKASPSFVGVRVYPQNNSQKDQFTKLSAEQEVTLYGKVVNVDEITGYHIELDRVLTAEEAMKEEQVASRTKERKNSQTEKKNLYDMSTPDGAFRYYHMAITKHDLRAAYGCFSDAHQLEMEYNGWAAGYDTTLQSVPEKIEITFNDGSHANLSFRLKAVDRVGGSTKTQYFVGECSLVKVNEVWRIESISGQPV